MDIDLVTFDGVNYPVATITVFKGTEDEETTTVSTRTLGNIIEDEVERGNYNKSVRYVDEKIGYFAPDSLIEKGVENDITKYVESIYW